MGWNSQGLAAGIALAFAVAGGAWAGEAEDLAEFRAFMAARNDRTSEIIRQAFPFEYSVMERRRASDYARTHDDEAAVLAVLSFQNEIRDLYFDQIANAPDDDLRAIAVAKLAQLKLLQPSEPVACHLIAEGGAIDDELASRLSRIPRGPEADTAFPQFLALKHARERPTRHAPLMAADREAILRDYVSRGGDRIYLESREKGSGAFSAADRCRNNILLGEAVLAMPSDLASRFWANAYR